MDKSQKWLPVASIPVHELKFALSAKHTLGGRTVPFSRGGGRAGVWEQQRTAPATFPVIDHLLEPWALVFEPSSLFSTWWLELALK